VAYHNIISQPLVKQGEKSFGYKIPAEYWNGTPVKEGIISIQAAFESPDWTLVFCNHNIIISFHVMTLHQAPSESDLDPGSEVSGSFCFKSHTLFMCSDLAITLEPVPWSLYQVGT
jgi:hypothetical protein